MNFKNQLKNQCRFHFVTKILSERQREIKNSLALLAFLTKVIKWNPSTNCLITARVNCCLGFGMRFISARCLMVFSSVAAGNGKCLMSWAQHLLSMLTHLNMIYVIYVILCHRNHYFDYFLKGFTVLSFILQLETYQQVIFFIWSYLGRSTPFPSLGSQLEAEVHTIGRAHFFQNPSSYEVLIWSWVIMTRKPKCKTEHDFFIRK